MKAMMLGVVKGALALVLTEKFLFNLFVLLAEWAAGKTSNDLDNRMVAKLMEQVDSRNGEVVNNLYPEVKERKVQG